MWVYYTGIGAKRKSGKHTKEEFLDVMRKTFVEKPSASYRLVWGSQFQPEKMKNYTFAQWVRWSGAEVVVEDA